MMKVFVLSLMYSLSIAIRFIVTCLTALFVLGASECGSKNGDKFPCRQQFCHDEDECEERRQRCEKHNK